MIRFINCLKAKPGMTPGDFRRWWDDPQFEALIQRVANLTGAASTAFVTES